MAKAIVVYATRTGETQQIGELIAEGLLAVEMGASAEDLSLTIHPHPTLSETVMEAAEAFL